MSQQPIYLDHQATTPLDPRVREAMLPFLGARFGNPHALDNATGWAAAQAVEEARREVAALIGAAPSEIVFTSGATESCNLAIRGHLAALGLERARLVTTPLEHPAVSAPLAELARRGHEVRFVRVDGEGRLDLAELRARLAGAQLASVILAHNEVGTLQPAAEIAALARAAGCALHFDAAQAVGKIRLDVGALGLDLLSFSAHKLHGPPGIGALFLRRGLALSPILLGGGQEGGLRPGTLPLALVVGFGVACRLAREGLEEEAERLGRLRDLLEARLLAALPGLRVNGARRARLPGSLHLSLPGVSAEAWMLATPGLALASGAACASGRREPSASLKAMGMSPAAIEGSLRIGLGRFTTEEEVERAAELLKAGLARIAPERAG